MDDKLWADGRIALRVSGPGAAADGDVVAIGRPYALVGRIPGADVRLDDPAVSARHAYLHLDRRGLFAVDLATRSGTRVGPAGRPAGWLTPGEALEVAGRRVEVLGYRADGAEPRGPGAGDNADPLADAGPVPLARVTLYPVDAPDAPLALGSELVFLGRSASCGVRVTGEAASRTHCVIVRAAAGAFIVDLVGRGTWLNERPLRGAAPLPDGATLMIGTARFEARVEPPGPRLPAPRRDRGPALPAELAPPAGGPIWTAELAAGVPPLPPGVVTPEGQNALLAWMMGILQAGQAEILRQQSEFQRSMALMVRQIHLDNSALLSRHMERVESINRELNSLREEIRHRFGADAGPNARPGLPALPPATPLKVTPHNPPADPVAATSWLMERVGQLERENRSTWKDLLGRLSRAPRR
jgi:pSer/pThr/pTyr-binding forkhead associated (FHA) protein